MRHYHFIKKINLNGLSQCKGCKKKGKFKVYWAGMMWYYTKDHQFYCDECKEELLKKYSN